jgi:hypothetical protein
MSSAGKTLKIKKGRSNFFIAAAIFVNKDKEL